MSRACWRCASSPSARMRAWVIWIEGVVDVDLEEVFDHAIGFIATSLCRECEGERLE
jgi:hypothetical protein